MNEINRKGTDSGRLKIPEDKDTGSLGSFGDFASLNNDIVRNYNKNKKNNIKKLLKIFKKNTMKLNKKISKFGYNIQIYSKEPFTLERFMYITFQPIGKPNIDVPLKRNKEFKILREAICSLFEIKINEKLDRDSYGIAWQWYGYYEINSQKFEFEVGSLVEDNKIQSFIIELPKDNFDFKVIKSIYEQKWDEARKSGKYMIRHPFTHKWVPFK